MSVMNPDVVLAPGLSVGISPEFSRVHRAMSDAGIHPYIVQSNGVNQRTEYEIAVSGQIRSKVDDAVARTEGLLERAGGLVVVNGLTEEVLNARGERLAGVPCAVGYFAFRLIAAANEVYGPESGRVFLTGSYPDATELFSVSTRHPVATRSRKRLLDLYPLRPVALRGNLAPAIEVIKTPRA